MADYSRDDKNGLILTLHRARKPQISLTIGGTEAINSSEISREFSVSVEDFVKVSNRAIVDGGFAFADSNTGVGTILLDLKALSLFN